ncbi:MAG: hypothetical protein JRD93_17360 [Deltaproteobacteria bacterium]|nr:hypothetical protein [Deltaproteobacteria bacterium]
MLDLIAKHERFIKSFHVFLYEQEGEMLRFKAQLTFTNNSDLFIDLGPDQVNGLKTQGMRVK